MISAAGVDRKFHDRAVVASLKPLNSMFGSGSGEKFHDRAVVASLKRWCPVPDRTIYCQIPRPRGRGLIEAIS